MEFNSFAEWMLQAMLTGAVIYAVSVLAKLKESIDELNKRIAVIIEKSAWHEKELANHEDRIQRIEQS